MFPRLVVLFVCLAICPFTGCSGKGNSGDSANDRSPAKNDNEVQRQADVDAQGTAHPAEHTDAPEASVVSRDIMEAVIGEEGFNTFVTALQVTGLAETLTGEGPFTVFAPTDQAFAALPEGTLEELLKPDNSEKFKAMLAHHIVTGKFMAADVVDLEAAKTVLGNEVAIQAANGKVTIDGATVTATDIECSNGVIHAIDAVILP